MTQREELAEILTSCTADALRKIAKSIRLAVSEEVVARQDVEDAARQLEARAEMIERGMG